MKKITFMETQSGRADPALKSEMEEWFDRYTDPKMDARKGGAVGRGQEKMCYEENAFDQSIELYYKDKEKCRV